jgi:hypothetical protein
MAFLAPVSFDLGNRHALDANFVQGFFDVIEFERLDDGLDFHHGKTSFFPLSILTGFFIRRR